MQFYDVQNTHLGNYCQYNAASKNRRKYWYITLILLWSLRLNTKSLYIFISYASLDFICLLENSFIDSNEFFPDNRHLYAYIIKKSCYTCSHKFYVTSPNYLHFYVLFLFIYFLGDILWCQKPFCMVQWICPVLIQYIGRLSISIYIYCHAIEMKRKNQGWNVNRHSNFLYVYHTWLLQILNPYTFGIAQYINQLVI